MNGGSGGSTAIREGGGWDGSWVGNTPELATNWGIGFDYTPSGNFLTGLNIQATYYVIKLTNVLQSFGNPTTNSFNDPELGQFAFLVPTDFANNPNLPGYADCTSNLLPTTCLPFQNAVQGLLNNPRNTVDPQAKTLIYWINDGGTFNKGYIKMDGIDFSASYDWDWGDIGAFNVGVVGTYYLHRWENPLGIPGAAQDMFHTTLLAGAVNEVAGRRIAPALPLPRSRGLVERSLVAHRLHERPDPLLPHAECAAERQRQFLRLERWTGRDRRWRDVSVRHRAATPTSFRPTTRSTCRSVTTRWTGRRTSTCATSASSSLCNNVMDKRSAYAYRIATGGGNPCTCDILNSLQGRTISLILTKEW